VDSRPIGFFDSGVGGLTVLQAVRRALPQEDILFVADQVHIPYGTRSLEEVRSFSVGVTRFLLAEGAKLIVVACNTASAAALKYLRQVFNDVPIVGMEPALKPAIEQTQRGVVGVLATQVTFQGELYATLVERFGDGVTILEDACIGLVKEIEAGNINTPATRAIIEKALHPMLAQGVDVVVLGCTHYPFVKDIIEEIAGQQVRVIDPSPAVARQVGRILEQRGLRRLAAAQAGAQIRFCTSASPAEMHRLLHVLPLQISLPESTQIQQLYWRQSPDMAWELHV